MTKTNWKAISELMSIRELISSYNKPSDYVKTKPHNQNHSNLVSADAFTVMLAPMISKAVFNRMPTLGNDILKVAIDKVLSQLLETTNESTVEIAIHWKRVEEYVKRLPLTDDNFHFDLDQKQKLNQLYANAELKMKPEQYNKFHKFIEGRHKNEMIAAVDPSAIDLIKKN